MPAATTEPAALKALIAYRHVLAPAVGALVLIAGALVFPGQLLASLIAGALVWGGAALLLSPSMPFAGLSKRAGLDGTGGQIEAELTAALARIERVRDAAAALTAAELKRPLLAIAETAKGIVGEVGADPADYPRVRKALVHYLGHVAAIADNLVKLEGSGGGTAARQRAVATLPRLAELFARYRERTLENETFDLETRIAVLERELEQSAPLPENPSAAGRSGSQG